MTQQSNKDWIRKIYDKIDKESEWTWRFEVFEEIIQKHQPEYELLEKIKELIEKYEKRLRKLKFKKVWTTEILDEMDLLNPFIKDLQSLLPTNKDEQTTK